MDKNVTFPFGEPVMQNTDKASEAFYPPVVWIKYPVTTTILLVLVSMMIILGLVTILRRVDPSPSNPTRIVLSVAVMISFIGLTSYSVIRPIPASDGGGQLLGALISAFTLVINFWFGSFRRDDANKEEDDAHVQ